jgi:tripartite-type tricarboxylate transporter receptor subunit TctC
MFTNLLVARPLIDEGKVRPIALTGSDRAEAQPDVPTFAELGMAGFDFDLRFGIFAPAKTPAGIIASLNSKIRMTLNDSTARAKISQQGVELLN